MHVLNSERLSLRRFDTADAGFVLRLLNEDAFLRYIGDKGVRDVDDAVRYLENGPIASYRDHGFGLFHVEEKDSGTAVGMCGLLQRDGQPNPDIGYALLNAFTAKGFAREAAGAVLEYGHRSLEIPVIDAFVNPDNERSIALLLKIGFVPVGTMHINGITGEQNVYRSSKVSA